MGKFDGIILCTDFDGTFACPGPVISPENAAAVKYFQENGGLFTIASGRFVRFVLSFDDFKPNAPVVAANGTMICDPATGERLEIFPLPDSASEIMDAAENLPYLDKIYICNTNGHGNIWTAAEGIPIKEFYSKVPKPWFTIVFGQTPEGALKLKEWAKENWKGRYEFSRSWNGGVEFQAIGSGKGVCIKRIKEMLNLRLTVGAGDYENDESLVRCADIGYAVANAVPVTKAAADRITVANTEHAIARIIEDIEREFT